MHEDILNLLRVALLCFLIMIGTIAGILSEPIRNLDHTEATTAAPSEPQKPAEKETPTETTHPETAPTADTEPPAEQETEPTYKQEDLELLALVIYQEAGADYCSDETRLMVGTVVMNRISDPRFPDAMYEVVTQKGAYGKLHWTGPVWPTRASKPEEAHAVARAYTIAERILQGERPLPEDVVFQSEYIMGEIVAYSDGLYFCR